MTRHPSAPPPVSHEVVIFLEEQVLIRKARQILRTDTHPQHHQLVNVLTTALALDPTDDFIESDPA